MGGLFLLYRIAFTGERAMTHRFRNKLLFIGVLVVGGGLYLLKELGSEASRAEPLAVGRTNAWRLPAVTDSLTAEEPSKSESPSIPAEQPARADEAASRLVVYYFHRTMRCPTCLSIEKQSRETIERTYGGELSAGTLEWHAVNIEEPGNEHFEKDFELQSQSLVLVEMAGERVTRWKLLPKVWDLAEDPYGFQEYVVAEVALFLGGG